MPAPNDPESYNWGLTEHNFRGLLAEQARTQRARREPVRLQDVSRALVAQTVLDHPGWQRFLDELVAQRARMTALLEVVKSAAISRDAAARETAVLEAQDITGVLKGLTFAIEAIPNAVAAGHDRGPEDPHA